MHIFENDKSYLIRQKIGALQRRSQIEDDCQSWILIVTTYIVRLITFHNKQILILVWVFMANDNVNNEAFSGTWLTWPFFKCQLRIVECFGNMAVEKGKTYCLVDKYSCPPCNLGILYHLFLTNSIVFPSFEKIYLELNISQLR